MSDDAVVKLLGHVLNNSVLCIYLQVLPQLQPKNR